MLPEGHKKKTSEVLFTFQNDEDIYKCNKGNKILF